MYISVSLYGRVLSESGYRGLLLCLDDVPLYSRGDVSLAIEVPYSSLSCIEHYPLPGGMHRRVDEKRVGGGFSRGKAAREKEPELPSSPRPTGSRRSPGMLRALLKVRRRIQASRCDQFLLH